MTPDAHPALTIYRLESDKTPAIRYAPLHRLALTIRHWIEGAPPRMVAYPQEVAFQLGLEPLNNFARQLNRGCIDALQYLARQATPGDVGIPATWYDLKAAEAVFTFVVESERREGETIIRNSHSCSSQSFLICLQFS